MKTLVVSDLDGTLLGPSALLSGATRSGINRLVAGGLLFSYATARSWESAHRVVEGIDLRVPVTVSGGAHQVDPMSGDPLRSAYLSDDDVATVIGLCQDHGVPPIVYEGTPAAERMMWVSGAESAGMKRFLGNRVDDRRLTPVRTWNDLPRSKAFYMTVIGATEAVNALKDDLAAETEGALSLIAQTDTHFPEDTYLELSASTATKAHAVDWLRAHLSVDRVVAFGDNLNDLPMFAAADEAYAVANAAPEVLAAADAVIGEHGSDGVLRWLDDEFSGTSG